MPEVGIDTASERGLEYLGSVRRPSGLWCDFRTAAGESDEWASAFVCAYLGGVPGGRSLRAPALSALAARQRADGGWGYNPRVASDCDSTAWALRALAGELAPEAAEAGCRFLLLHQDESGGFSTYQRRLRPQRPGLRADWFRPQPCVTAAAVAALRERFPEAAARGVSYLARTWAADQPSCWWGRSAYVRLGVLESVGGAATGPRAAGGSFELAHQALLLLREQSREADRIVRLLRAGQEADGSWRGCPILHVPDDRPGRSIVAEDHNRTFATVSALRALAAARRGEPAAS